MAGLSRFMALLLVLACAAALGQTPPRGKPPAAKTADDEIKNPWPKLSDDEQTAAVAEMKKIADEANTKFDKPLNLKLIETKYFLFSSDLPAKEAQNWAGLLDKMYARLAELFGVPKGENVWRGKALIFVFAHQGDFSHFEIAEFGAPPGPGIIGLCHQNSSGKVIVTFFRQTDELEFAHVLVHESVHGFIHRYLSPARVPSWANEGLAETIATELVPQPGRKERVKANARAGLEQHGENVADFFSAEHIAGWQYPVSEMLSTFMISQSKKGYVDFIKAIKNGVDDEDALNTKYKAPRDRLIAAFGKSLGLQHLQ